MAHGGTFATVINCMDGRVQLPVIEWMKQKHKVEYVDSITEPGPVRILAEGRDSTTIESVRRRVHVSVSKHGSTVVTLIAHDDCAGNPVSKEVQLRQLPAALRTIRSWGHGVTVEAIWVDEHWTVHEVPQS